MTTKTDEETPSVAHSLIVLLGALAKFVVFFTLKALTLWAFIWFAAVVVLEIDYITALSAIELYQAAVLSALVMETWVLLNPRRDLTPD